MYKKKILIALALTLPSIDSAIALDKGNYDRQTSQYLPQGSHLGSFTLLPSFEFQNAYNSNIFYRDKITASGKAQSTPSSYVAHFKPGVAINSNWNRHALGFKLDTDLAQYVTLPDQNNYNDVHTSMNGLLDVVRDSSFTGNIGYNYLHESRGSPDQVNGIGPTFYNTVVFDGLYKHKINRVTVLPTFNFTNYAYQDVKTATGSTLLMSTRSHQEFMPSLRVSYEIQPSYEAFLKIVYKEAKYDQLVYTNGTADPKYKYNRNSTGYNFLTGLAFDVSDLVTADVSIGYLTRNYVDAKLKPISGMNGFIDLKWQITKLTTLDGKVSRDINETTQAGVSGLLATGISLGVDHELRRNIHLMLGGSYTKNDYNGVAPVSTQGVRSDSLYSGNVGVKYLLNRYLSTDLSYSMQNRTTNYIGNGYDQSLVMLNVRTQY